MENLSAQFNNIREELGLNMANAKFNKVRKILEDLISNSEITKEQISDIIAETCFLDDQSFMLNVYPKLRIKIAKKFTLQGETGMEYYIVNKYCLYDKEKIIDHFVCSIKRKQKDWYNFNGAVILTNFRLIIYGNRMKTELGMPKWDILETNGACDYSLQKIFQSIGQSFVPKPCYGYQFPILGAYKPSSNEKSLTFSIILQYQKKKKKNPILKTEKERITIEPGIARKGETRKEFKERCPKNIDSLVQTILFASQYKVF
ncbi:MAG: hypothetical protein ACFFAH_02175 [Promethearchaeota archaeon]